MSLGPVTCVTAPSESCHWAKTLQLKEIKAVSPPHFAGCSNLPFLYQQEADLGHSGLEAIPDL